MDSKSLNMKPRLAKKKNKNKSLDDDEDDAKLKAFCEQWNTSLCPFASREDRNWRADMFLNYDAKYQKHYPVIKAWTWPDAAEDDTPLLKEEWLGITWVALHVNDSLCVVALANDLERLENGLLRDEEDMTTLEMWNALVNEVEGIEDRHFDRSCRTPFSVVTVVSGNSKVCKISGDESQQASSAEFRAKMSCKFLRNQMKSGEIFTFDKTIQTTISAFQHLFGREVKAHEIRAFALKDSHSLGKELKQWRKHPDLDELLASIYEPDNDDPDTLTPKKGVAPGLTDVFFKEADGSCTFSGKSKESDDTLFLEKLKAADLKECKKSRDQRRQRRKKVRKLRSKKATKEIEVRKLRSKKATKEIGDAQDTVEHCVKYDVALKTLI